MKRVTILTGLFLLSVMAFSQKASNQTILTIGEFQFPEGEFWHIYNKNKDLSAFSETPEQFAERFINYKLKVVDAISYKMDTLNSFVSEFGQYADELAAGYMIDSAAIEQAARSAYNNMTKFVNASHILIALPRNRLATPADTLKAYEKIKEIRDKALSGEDFGALAAEFSEDPSAVQNNGELGNFTAFQMVYPFEKAAFSTPVGKISEIIRSPYGYHIIKVNNVMTVTGKMKVAHIMKMFPRSGMKEDTEEKLKFSIDSIYAAFKKGADFSELAKLYSDDKNSAVQGGEMPAISIGQIPVFSEEAFKLKTDGEVSAPIRSPFGWHIIKRIGFTPIEDYKTAYPNIISMMSREGDERGQIGHTAYIDKKRNSPAFKINKAVWDEISQFAVNEENNETCFKKFTKNDNRILFEYETAKVTVNEFLDYLKTDKLFIVAEGIVSMEKSMNRIASDVILKVERQNLPKTCPIYQYLANEYHDGLLIFELSNKKIWSKVGADTVALYEHYLNYLPEFSENPTLNGKMWYVNNAKLIQKINKELSLNPKANLTEIFKKVDKSGSKYRFMEGSFSFAKEENNPVEANVLPVENPFKNSEGAVYWQGALENGAVIPFENIKGEVMNSYQTKLENDWIKELREKYQPVFNMNLLKKKK